MGKKKTKKKAKKGNRAKEETGEGAGEANVIATEVSWRMSERVNSDRMLAAFSKCASALHACSEVERARVSKALYLLYETREEVGGKKEF